MLTSGVMIVGLGNTNGGRFTTFAGGLPIVNSKGVVVGGVSSRPSSLLC